ncbi:MAG: glutamate dehydrogenase, partial [Rhodospirillaceae bacterium]|nr:glutamate dehydrogenase [Rhodospirillaceae bacterium]
MTATLLDDVRRNFGARFIAALKHSALPDEALLHLTGPARVLKARLPVKSASSTATYDAWRLNFVPVFGPTKGGVRFHPGVDEKSLTTLAGRILLKCAVNALPHGGAAGGVAVAAGDLTPLELEILARQYVAAFDAIIGEDRDILSPDLGTDARVMAWMADEIRVRRGRWENAAVNGK